MRPMRRQSRGIYAAKDRPRFNPLIAHVADIEWRRAARACSMRGAALARGILARPADPRGAGAAPAARSATSPARASTASACGCRPIRSRCAAGGGRPAGRRALRQPLRAGQPDRCRPCPGRPRRRIDMQSSKAGATQVGVESTIVACLDGTRPPAAAGRRSARGHRGGDRARPRGSSSQGPALRSPPACWRLITRRGRECD